MSCPFTHEELEDHADQRLPEPRAREVDAHAARCSDCRDELDWLRLERLAFDEREASGDGHTAELWSGIEARIEASAASGEAGAEPQGKLLRLGGRQRVAWFGSGFAAAAMAASVLFFYVRAPQVAEPQPTQIATDAGAGEKITAPVAVAESPATATLTKAEAQYTEAIAALEAEFAARRAELPAEVASAHEQTFEHSRHLISDARQHAGDDVDARMRVLDAYSTHLRAVQTAMTSLD